MVAVIVRYAQMIRQINAESYQLNIVTRRMQILALISLAFFVAGFIAGGADIVRRPVEPIYLLVVMVFFVGAIFIYVMVDTQRRMAQSLRQKNMEIMRAFVNSIEMKDDYTQGHSQHVFRLVGVFAQALPRDIRAQIKVPRLLDAALLHDIGKISISDAVLNKNGPLTEDEWAIMRDHPRTGKIMLEDTCYQEIGHWVLYHHERMDGKGYYGMDGQAIPIESRMIAISDTYSALTTDREYRRGVDHEQAVKIMKSVAGTQLDAELLSWFVSIPPGQLERCKSGLYPLEGCPPGRNAV